LKSNLAVRCERPTKTQTLNGEGTSVIMSLVADHLHVTVLQVERLLEYIQTWGHRSHADSALGSLQHAGWFVHSHVSGLGIPEIVPSVTGSGGKTETPERNQPQCNLLHRADCRTAGHGSQRWEAEMCVCVGGGGGGGMPPVRYCACVGPSDIRHLETASHYCGPIRCPETLIKVYHWTVRNAPEERTFQVLLCFVMQGLYSCVPETKHVSVLWLQFVARVLLRPVLNVLCRCIHNVRIIVMCCKDNEVSCNLKKLSFLRPPTPFFLGYTLNSVSLFFHKSMSKWFVELALCLSSPVHTVDCFQFFILGAGTPECCVQLGLLLRVLTCTCDFPYLSLFFVL
jgi:hypothetical protein